MMDSVCLTRLSLKTSISVGESGAEFPFLGPYVSHYARRYRSNGMIHVQLSFRETARALNKFRLKVDFWQNTFSTKYKVQWQQIHRTVERFSTSQTLADILYRCPCATTYTFDLLTFLIFGQRRFSTFATFACATAIQNFKRL